MMPFKPRDTTLAAIIGSNEDRCGPQQRDAPASTSAALPSRKHAT
jgi:hypothetical protein